MRRVGLLVGATMLLGVLSCGRAENSPGGAELPAAAADAGPSGTPTDAPAPGVTPTRVLFGQSVGFSGPVAGLARDLRLGIETAFHEVNGRGGVHGRRLELVTRDDHYDPDIAIANTRYFIEDEPVFALIGALGTSQSRAAVPVAAAANLPYLAPYTGAAFLHDPAWSHVLNLRASYDWEAEMILTQLAEEMQLDRIGVLYQDHSAGRAAHEAIRRALARRALEPVSTGLIPRGTTAVKSAVFNVVRGDPDAVILFGAATQVAETTRWGRQLGLDAILVALSPVGNSLPRALGPAAAGVYVVQVVPVPTDDSLPVTGVYRRALAAHDAQAEPGSVSLEGYLAGRLAITGLERCGRALTQTCFLDVLRSEPVDLDGFELRYGDGDNAGSESVFLTRIGPDGAHHPVATLTGRALPRRR